MSSFDSLKVREAENVMQTYGRFNLALDHGKGAKLYDLDGNEYIDMTSGIGVNCLGHDHPVLTKALEEQIHKLLQASNLYYTKPMIDAAEKLVIASGMKKVFFSNSGAEANEGAIKCARKYAADKYGKDRYKVLTLENSFHGRTIATLEATGQDHFHQHFFPFTEGFDYISANDAADLAAHDDGTVCAVMMELIQGESGVRPLDPDYVKAVADYCKEHDILLIVDEVQTGIGRTGSLFCFQNYDLEPDVVTMAKGLGGGIPVGGFLANKKTSSVLGAGDHGTTFGGNPLAMACANTVLDTITDPAFLAEVNRKGEDLRQFVKDLDSPYVRDVRGQGLMTGIEVGADNLSRLVQACMDNGLLVLKAGSDTIRLLPPLVITDEDLAAAKDVFARVLK